MCSEENSSQKYPTHGGGRNSSFNLGYIVSNEVPASLELELGYLDAVSEIPRKLVSCFPSLNQNSQGQDRCVCVCSCMRALVCL